MLFVCKIGHRLHLLMKLCVRMTTYTVFRTRPAYRHIEARPNIVFLQDRCEPKKLAKKLAKKQGWFGLIVHNLTIHPTPKIPSL